MVAPALRLQPVEGAGVGAFRPGLPRGGVAGLAGLRPDERLSEGAGGREEGDGGEQTRHGGKGYDAP